MWEFYQYLCMKRNHETRLSLGTISGFIEMYGYKRASKFNLLKELKTTKWIAGDDGAYMLTFGDFSSVDKRADERKMMREQQSKKIDFHENQSKNLDSKSKKIDEKSKKIDSHIRNNQLSYQHSQDSIESFEGERTRPRTEIPVDEIFEISEPQLDEISTTAIRIYRDVFPTAFLDGQVLTEFAARLPEVEESVWRQTLLDWRLARYKATNIPAMISRYKKDLAESKKEQNGKIQPNNFKSAAEIRDERAINAFNAKQQLRAKVAERNAIPRGNVSNR